MFKDTKAFELITIAEKMSVKNRFKNAILFIVKMQAYTFTNEHFRIKKNLSPEKMIKLFKEYFKEVIYSYTTIHNLNIVINTADQVNHITYTFDYGNIDATIGYNDIKLYISYNPITDHFTVFLVEQTTNKGVNIDERNLKIDEIKDTAYCALNLLFNTANLFTMKIFEYYHEKTKEAYSRKEK